MTVVPIDNTGLSIALAEFGLGHRASIAWSVSIRRVIMAYFALLACSLAPMVDETVPELDRDEVAKVAGLAMLELTDEELDTFTPQLGAILAHAKDMESLDLGDVPPTHHPYPLTNVMRPDVVAPDSGGPELRDAVLAEAPDVEDNRFKVPPALGGD